MYVGCQHISCWTNSQPELESKTSDITAAIGDWRPTLKPARQKLLLYIHTAVPILPSEPDAEANTRVHTSAMS